MDETLNIDRVGHRGDGIADSANGAVYVPYALTGERVRVSGNSAKRSLVSIENPSPDRAIAFCRHFGKCGGCQMQHFEHSAYLAWKQNILKTTLENAGIDIELELIRHYPRSSRRRAVLTGIKTQSGVLLGFSGRASNTIIELAECPVLLPKLEALLPQVQALCHIFAPRKGVIKATIVSCSNGVDLALNNGQKVDDKDIRRAIGHEAMQGFIRLSLNGEIILEKERPVLRVGKAFVTPPPEGFVQACSAAENDMAELVQNHLKSCKKIVDLFCGFGPFALRLAENSEVIASESNDAALKALDRAWRETGGTLKKLTTDKRDLYRRPFNVQELKYIDGALFDPPRAGAELQSQQLAKSNVKKIAAISCNPATLARDLNILIEGGFKLISVTPIDQFSYTPHLEAVALLQR